MAPPRPAGRGLLPVPAPCLALPAPLAPKADTSTVTVEGRPVKRLTQAKQEERHRLGLCYNCDEKFGRGHNRVCKRLFLLDCAVEEDINEAVAGAELAQTEESPAFSLHAIAGVRATDTMQIDVNLAGHAFITLLDSMATGLPLQHRPCLTATVANGDRVSCVGVIRQAAITIHGDMFLIDLFVMPLAGYDMVLGTQWLATLGPIRWDFGGRSLTFKWHGKSVCWQGLSGAAAFPGHTVTATPTLLDELIASFANAFTKPHGLPLHRSQDHGITLVSGVQPVAVRP
jgi:hypothetical protein